MSKQQAASSKQRGGLYAPAPARVRIDGSSPVEVDGKRVDSIREEWLVEDRWWAAPPLRRHYVELVLDSGRCLTLYRDLVTGGWFVQR
jgi:hypothetical protein